MKKHGSRVESNVNLAADEVALHEKRQLMEWPQDLRSAFTRCWTNAHDHPNYRKKDWMMLEGLLDQCLRKHWVTLDAIEAHAGQIRRHAVELESLVESRRLRPGDEEASSPAPNRTASTALQPFRIVVGNTEPAFDELLAEAIRNAIAREREGLDLRFTFCSTMDQIEDLAGRENLDLTVVILNNLQDCDVATVLGRVSAFKQMYKKPILALSGSHPPHHSRASFREAALEAGADAFLWLPFSVGELDNRIRALIPSDDRPEPPTPRERKVAFPAEGIELHWDSDTLQIHVTDHHAGPLCLPWKDLATLAKTATGDES